MIKTNNKKSYAKDNMDEHYLVIIDNMVSPIATHSPFTHLI